MTTPHLPQDGSGPIGRVYQRLARWWRNTPESRTLPDPACVPTVEQALEHDACTRWVILAVLQGTDEVSWKFITTITHRSSAEERERSLDWLLTTGCIREERRWYRREFFWQRRREYLTYAITPIGTALLARIKDTATAEQLGIQAETTDPLRNGIPRWWYAVYVALYVVLLALMAAVLVPLLQALFR